MGQQMLYRKAGEVAPPLEVVDPEHGDAKSLADLIGAGSTVIYWIKTGCPTCQLAIPFVDRIAAKVPAGRIVVVAQDDPDSVAAFRSEYGLQSVPIYCEPEPFDAANEWGLTHVPTWFLVDSDGTIQKSGMMFSQPDLQQTLVDLGGEGVLFRDGEKEELPETRPG